jgi:hypothetical protein
MPGFPNTRLRKPGCPNLRATPHERRSKPPLPVTSTDAFELATHPTHEPLPARSSDEHTI